MQKDVPYQINRMLAELGECSAALRRGLVLVLLLVATALVLLLFSPGQKGTDTIPAILLGIAAAGLLLGIGCAFVLSERIRAVLALRGEENDYLAESLLSRHPASGLTSPKPHIHSKNNSTMKRIFLFLAAASLVGMAACNKPESHSPEASAPEEGTIEFSLSPEDGAGTETRAVTAYTTAQTYETQVNKVQIFVFDSDGKIAAYKDNGTSLTGSINTTAGAKTVWAVINGPDLASVGTLSALQGTAVDLSANSTTASTGFVMAGSGSCTVSGTGSVNCQFSVSRLVSRIALVNVVNNLPSSYGALKIERVFLCNVVGNQNLAGNASPSTWYNKDGRADESTRNATHIINGTTYKASCESLTFKSVGQNVANGSTHTPSTPYLFYAYPNSATAAPDGFSSTFSAKRTVLTVAATIGDGLYYYPVVLDDAVLARNTAYTVGLTITGLGSDDPNKPVTKGSIAVTVTVSGWSSGAVYDETI